MKRSFPLFIFSLLVISLSGQSRVEPGITLRPSLSTINSGTYDKGYQHTFTFSYGLDFIVFGDRMAFSYGLLQLSGGATYQMEHTTVEKPEGTNEFIDMKIRVKAISVPVSMYYLFPLGDHLLLMPGAGVYSNMIYAQEQVVLPGSDIECIEPGFFTFEPNVIPCTTSLSLFEAHYFAVTPLLGVSHSIGDHLRLRATAGYFIHLRQDRPSQYHAYTPRLRSFTLAFTLNYRLN